MTELTPRARPARPVWDPQVWQLLEQSDELTKGWLLELVERRPLARAESLLVGRLAAGGPQLCDALVRALGSDQDLTVLQPGGAMATVLIELGPSVDAHGAFELSAALELLRGVIAAALRRCLVNPDPDLVWALGERMSLVFEIARGTALSGTESVRTAVEHTPAQRSGPAEAAGPLGDPIVDDPVTPVSVQRRAVTALRPDLGDRWSEAEQSAAREDALSGLGGDVEWDDGDQGAEVLGAERWIPSLEDAIADARRRMSSLALLMVELEEPSRLLAALGGERTAEIFLGFRQAVRAEVRRGDFMVDESDTRVWVVSRDSRSDTAREHAERIAETIGRLAPWRGVPPSVAIGFATLGEDANTAEGLIEAAEEARYAATAAGVTVGPPR